MRTGLVAFGTVAVFLASLTPTVGQALNEHQRALQIIAEHAQKVCPPPGTTGSRTEIGGDAKIKADVAGLTRRLIDVGGEIGGRARRTTWDGVAQEQLAQVIQSGNDCRLKLYELLVPHFMPPSVPRNPETSRPYALNIVYEHARQAVAFAHLYPTSIACLQEASNSFLASARQIVGVGRECKQVPSRPVCWLDAGFERSPPYPHCFWSVQECESAYRHPRNSASVTAVGGRARAACEEIAWDEALRINQTWWKAIGTVN
jgi:hypothetical protein